MKDDMISFEFFLELLALHKTPPFIIQAFAADYGQHFKERERTENQWLIIFEVWGKLVKEELAAELLDKFHSDKVQ